VKIYICHKCLSLYVEERPFVCSCNSNVFISEYESSQEMVDKLVSEGKVNLVEDFEPMRV